MVMRQPIDAFPLVFVAFNGRVIACNRRTGARAWVLELTSYSSVRLVTDGARLWLTNAGIVMCVEAVTGRVIWRVDGVPTGTLLVQDDQVFVGSDGIVNCFAAHDGRCLWSDGFKGLGRGEVAFAVPGATAQADVVG